VQADVLCTFWVIIGPKATLSPRHWHVETSRRGVDPAQEFLPGVTRGVTVDLARTLEPMRPPVAEMQARINFLKKRFGK
jgi:hypothetical protein